MRIYGHIAGGILSTGLLIAIGRPPDELANRLLVLGAVSGSLPDWDILIYFIRKRSLKYDTDFRHHTWVTHTFPFYLVPALVVYIGALVTGNTQLQWAALVFAMSTSTHLIQDMYGSGDGIMILYPISRRMFGWELTGTHGPEWLEQYLKSKAYKLEIVTIASAALFLTAYLVVRLQLFAGLTTISVDWLGVFAAVSRYLYLAVTLFYGAAIGILLTNLTLQGLVRLTDHKPRIIQPSAPGPNPLKSSLALNALLALVTNCGSVAIIAALPLTLPTKLTLLPFTVSTISYLWGWKATGLGVINGTAWTVVSLGLFAFLEPQVSWWSYAPYFLLLNLISNLSGWLGGFVSCGQTRESECVTNIELKVHQNGAHVTQLLHEIQNVITKCFEDKWGKCKRVNVDDGHFTIADFGEDSDRRGVIIHGKLEMQWIYGYRPGKDALLWPFQRPITRRRLNEIIDYVFNWHRQVATYVVVNISPSKEANSALCVQLVIMTFRETPSIVWVDKEVIDFAQKQHTTLLKSIENALFSEVSISQQQFTVIRSWKGKLKLEQFAKDTWLVQATQHSTALDMRIDDSANPPDTVMMEFQTSSTSFDRWRGRATTFVVFVSSQVLLGIAVNIMATMFGQVR